MRGELGGECCLQLASVLITIARPCAADVQPHDAASIFYLGLARDDGEALARPNARIVATARVLSRLKR